jgi:apoptosis-inducing factor 3
VELPHVIALRSLADCRRILGALKDIRHVAVIGGSFIALETAASLRSRGLSVSVIAPEPHPMEKIFGRALSDLILDVHRDNGVTLRLSSKATRIQDHSVVLENGQEVSADMVILGVGVEPRLEIAQAAGLALDRGLVVDSRLETSAEDIFGAGDIARWPDPHSGQSIRVEHWVVAERQGQAAASNMLGADRPFQMVPFFWTKHFDLSIRYVGHAEQWDDMIVEGDLSRRNAIVRIRGKGRDLAVATIGRDDESLRAEFAMERQLRESEQK